MPEPCSAFSPNTVVILGAGATTCVGYPVGLELLPDLTREAESTTFENFRSAWTEWNDFRRKAQDALAKGDNLARLLLSSNPEIALSAIDLMDLALEWEDSDAQRAGFARATENVQAGVGMLEKYFEGDKRRALIEARAARNSLVQSLHWYFFVKHATLRHRPSGSRDYLRTMLDGEGFREGDVILTTNWDAVTELTLGENGMWNPFDGYGFKRTLVNGVSRGDGTPVPLPSTMPRSSKVKVLKLHGSFGWREWQGHLYLDYSEFLFNLPFQHGSTMVLFKDTAAPAQPNPGASILLYPSFLKRLRTPELHEVWYLAGEALRVAKKVVVVGYSLPEADAAVRTLLLPLRFRAMQADVEVMVIDKSDTALVRWQEFLEGKAQELRVSVCDDSLA